MGERGGGHRQASAGAPWPLTFLPGCAPGARRRAG